MDTNGSVYFKSELITFLKKVFNGHVDSKGQNFKIVCPFCSNKKAHGYSKKKLEIFIDGPVHFCNCWVCDYKSKNLIHLIKITNKSYLKEYLDKFVEKQPGFEFSSPVVEDVQPSEKVCLPESFQLLALAENTSHVLSLKEYLKSRLTDFERDLWYWRLGFSSFDEKEYRNRIIIPSYDASGDLNYFTARHIKGYNPKYKNPENVKREDIVFNEINIDWTKELTLVEGPFDLMKCNDNATCVLGSSLNQDYYLFRKIVQNETPILLAYDPDAILKALSLAKLFSEYNVSVRILDIPKSFKAKDVGELTKSQFNQLSQDARLYTANFDLYSRLNLLT